MPRTIVVVPCFNEEKRLRPDAFRTFAASWPGGAFLFVDDGSTDNTAQRLTELRESRRESFQVLSLPRNVGKAEAVRRGLQRAFEDTPEYVGFWDADLATPLGVVPLFEEVFRQRPEVDIVLGSRVQLLGRRIERRAVRHYLSRGFATGVAVVLGLNVYDSQCGAKLFRVNGIIREVFASPFLSRWIFDVEVLARFIKLKGRQSASDTQGAMYELPLPEWRDVAGSRLRTRDFGRALVDLWRIWRVNK